MFNKQKFGDKKVIKDKNELKSKENKDIINSNGIATTFNKVKNPKLSTNITSKLGKVEIPKLKQKE